MVIYSMKNILKININIMKEEIDDLFNYLFDRTETIDLEDEFLFI